MEYQKRRYTLCSGTARKIFVCDFRRIIFVVRDRSADDFVQLYGEIAERNHAGDGSV